MVFGTTPPYPSPYQREGMREGLKRTPKHVVPNETRSRFGKKLILPITIISDSKINRDKVFIADRNFFCNPNFIGTACLYKIIHSM
jgi:hypothetical protein